MILKSPTAFRRKLCLPLPRFQIMHVVSNIRDLKGFLNSFPLVAEEAVSEEECMQRYSAPNARAYHYDLVFAKVVLCGSTFIEDSDGNERELVLGEWLISPLIGRESSLEFTSIIPSDGIAVGTVVDHLNSGGGLGISFDNPPDKSNPTQVRIMGILQYENGRVAKSLDFTLRTKISGNICPVVAVVGSRSGAGKTTACLDIIKQLHQNNKTVGVAKLSGTMTRKEIIELSEDANQALDIADAGMPTTYPPSQDDADGMVFTIQQAILAAERILHILSVENEIIVVEFGGDLLSASVPELLAEHLRFNIVTVILVAESATAAIGMETKLFRISESYKSIPKYIVGPTANLLANRNRVERETDCSGCYDLWTKYSTSAPRKQIDISIAHTEELKKNLQRHCNI